MHGIHYAVSIFIATAVLWLLVHELANRDPIWPAATYVYIRQQLEPGFLSIVHRKAREIQGLICCDEGILLCFDCSRPMNFRSLE